MNTTQVFSHTGIQRAILLDPTKTYELNKLEGIARLEGCRSPVNFWGIASGEWETITQDTVTGMYAVRAVLAGNDGKLSVKG